MLFRSDPLDEKFATTPRNRLLNLTSACCTPARTLVGLRLPGEENDPTSGGTICAALYLGTVRPIPDVKFHIRQNGFPDYYPI